MVVVVAPLHSQMSTMQMEEVLVLGWTVRLGPWRTRLLLLLLLLVAGPSALAAPPRWQSFASGGRALPAAPGGTDTHARTHAHEGVESMRCAQQAANESQRMMIMVVRIKQ